MDNTYGRKRIRLQGADNFRDLGGFETREGKLVCWGKLYRSDSLAYLTNKDVCRLAQLGIRCVIDLRSELERERDRDVLGEGMRYVVCQLQNGNLDIHGSAQDGVMKEFMHSLTQSYTAMVKENVQYLVRALETLIDALSKGAVVFHCAAGKDRTGVLAAVLYTLLGVSEEDIIADYEVSYTYNLRMIQKLAKVISGFDAMLPMINSDAQNMRTLLAFFKEIRLEEYLLNNGLSARKLDDLRSKMLCVV